MQIHHCRAKIIATLGPASSDFDTIERLHLSGANVFRFNFSHGTHQDHAKRYAQMRAVEAKHGEPVAVLADLQGPKIRIATFEAGEEHLIKGQSFHFLLKACAGNEQQVQLPHPEVFDSVAPGDMILVDDGRLRFQVNHICEGIIQTRVMVGGIIKERKGVNLLAHATAINPLTKKDERDLAFALSLGADWIALSFVQTGADIIDLRTRIGDRAKICAKIEKPAAIDNFDDIVAQADAIMVARGDLGVELDHYLVPSLQKMIISKCRDAGKPVIVATQALESMVTNPIPTRAETSDIATAIYDGADAVMLSAETASGHFPVEAVSTMSDIIAATEKDPLYWRGVNKSEKVYSENDPDTIASAACHIAQKRRCAVIETFTETGATAIRVSRYRCEVPILAITPHMGAARQLALAWGIRCTVTTNDATTMENLRGESTSLPREKGYVQTGDRLVITSGSTFGEIGGTDFLRIVTAK